MSVVNCQTGTKQGQKRLDEIALSLPQKKFTEVTLEQEKLKIVGSASRKRGNDLMNIVPLLWK
ncbi:MAG: hypothetical protein MGG37_23075 [Trichodesmium sp. MAG_R01]|nr:hypothetical protein [Trichodesmium sp. MAG_R01]